VLSNGNPNRQINLVWEIMKLDDFDTRLYEELQRDGRASMEDLARAVGLSRVAIRSRFARLLESGALRVIGIVHPNVQELNAFAHLSIAVNGSAIAVGEAIANFANAPLVSVVAGRSAVIAEVRSTNTVSLRALVHDVTAIPDVARVETAVYTERIKDLYSPPSAIPPADIDEIDHQILEILELDGRSSFAEIARATFSSESVIRRRVNHLIDKGAVRISAILTPGVMGLQYMCGFGLRFSGGTERGSIALIESMPAVSYLSLTLGRWDVIGTILAKSQKDVVAQLDRIRTLEGIEGFESWTHLQVLKENYRLTNTAGVGDENQSPGLSAF
jgi:DNA-binding Lrp family transcriptional regulator